MFRCLLVWWCYSWLWWYGVISGIGCWFSCVILFDWCFLVVVVLSPCFRIVWNGSFLGIGFYGGCFNYLVYDVVSDVLAFSALLYLWADLLVEDCYLIRRMCRWHWCYLFSIHWWMSFSIRMMLAMVILWCSFHELLLFEYKNLDVEFGKVYGSGVLLLSFIWFCPLGFT